MSGDRWYRSGPWAEDLSAAFRRAQEEGLADVGGGFEGRDIDGLWADGAWCEYMATRGTGSAASLHLLIDPEAEEEWATLRPLTGEEVRAWAPGGRPTRAEWLEARENGRIGYPAHGRGRCTVLYADGEPVEVMYWGSMSG
ncbi:hypothetical protein LO771_09015 [Streptacidiphilus sp. ASG 303]|uniref:hypothetical protein n=1 Tax=Streptacidiphilus sp. ASG 303 TaxID=2896847 RepID=UPI001E648D5B|nr:hypothetical protein [Streptacidiphilus sp. ASG 303]MCD0482538.1 hypothetical protein [Streptacidiphilus sp. ASG 303]